MSFGIHKKKKINLFCWDIALIDIDNYSKSAWVQKRETLTFIPIGKEEWFIMDNGLLVKAESMYGLLERVKEYWRVKYDEPGFDLASKEPKIFLPE